LGLMIYLLAALDSPFRGEISVGPEAFEIMYSRRMVGGKWSWSIIRKHPLWDLDRFPQSIVPWHITSIVFVIAVSADTPNSVTGAEGAHPSTHCWNLIPIDQTEMNNFKSYPTWIKSDDNSDAGITVYNVACYLSQGIQNVFAFERDAYLDLVDQAEGLTDAQRIELEELAKLPDREAFWMLFNQCVSPITIYRIETHNLQCSQTSSRHERFRIRTRSESYALPAARKEARKHATGRHFAAREDLKWSLLVNQFWTQTSTAGGQHAGEESSPAPMLSTTITWRCTTAEK
jgi:hypothetical protein